MAQDIFSRKTDVFGGAFAADQASLTFPSLTAADTGQALTAEVGLLIQQLQLSYNQQITRLYEVGRPAVYLVAGRTAGDSSVDRVVGPRALTDAFYRKYGDVCQAAGNTLSFQIAVGCNAPQAGASGGASQPSFLGSVAYTAHFVVLSAIGVRMAAQDMLIGEFLQMMFSNLQRDTPSIGLSNAAA